MQAFKVQVRNGRITVDEPTDLPEGTELYLLPVDEELEDRLDVDAANEVVGAVKDGEQPLALDELKRQLGL
jgi:hypothetical protein